MSAIAVLKIGSTTTALLIANNLSTPIVYEQSVVNLFAKDAPVQLDQTLARFTQLADQFHCPRRLAAGGEAIRQLPHLATSIHRWGWPLWPIDGQMEGHLTWFAVKALEPQMDWIIDIGGGSTEFASSQHIISLPIGAATTLRPLEWPQDIHAEEPYVVGGTAHALSLLIGQRVMQLTDIDSVAEHIIRHPERLNFMDPVRRAIFPNGLKVIQEIMRHYRWSKVTYSPYGFLQGIWLACALGKDQETGTGDL
ncbi:hypothetical protein [Sulfobacillus thermosulfidooxidans]|uniref:Ppx/GppA phosphatase family protein n=1 Tax=Sulfobacillus thermosulfidooxidans TaxID=28034 RepID=UPI00096BB9B4|nr:hypothetical protein [Sulfobacillus thermosulfidooxidans]OLZ09548.1 hypothetical protein BFX05_11290 [Sulfobacillus thermosulfidooxidans]OLZ16146.1 hypothetical protein BFX06_03750 [Sulfobacillus thermosulfidooxidans]OLZ18006.1 hypothetical protein BFX07_06380 [Sulfobacillus thermosulfidooxidans]